MSIQVQNNALRSCLYEARIMHQRLVPKRHRFSHGAFWFFFDLSELPQLTGSLRMFGSGTGRIYEFRESDHLNLDGQKDGLRSLPDRVKEWLRRQGVVVPEDIRISLLTLPRVLGYVFNPVSFYFIEKSDGTPLTAISEVGNTFGEQKLYLIPLENTASRTGDGRFRCIVPKYFYVSPFSPLDWSFDFRLRFPANTLSLAIDDLDSSGTTTLATRLTGVRHPLTDRILIRMTFTYPLVTLRVIALIHRQALSLWLRRVPWFAKRDRAEMQREVLRPHESIASKHFLVSKTTNPSK